MKDVFSLSMKVRDYECDLQGIVNNAVYFHYLEHARHEFLLNKNISFADLHDNGFDAVVVKAELNYKASLKSKDTFTVYTNVKRDGRIKILFEQKIINNKTNKLILDAKILTTVLKNGKPHKIPQDLEQLF